MDRIREDPNLKVCRKVYFAFIIKQAFGNQASSLSNTSLIGDNLEVNGCYTIFATLGNYFQEFDIVPVFPVYFLMESVSSVINKIRTTEREGFCESSISQ